MKKIKLSFLAIVFSFLFLLTACVGESIDKTSNKAPEAINNIIQEKPSLSIPADCISWFDGCNNCFVIDGEISGCTRKFCSEETLEEPRCLKTKDNKTVYEEELLFKIGPEKINCANENNQECLVVDGELFYDDIEDFYFEPGFEYQVRVKKTVSSDDSSTVKYKLIDILSKTKK